jgi:type II secretory pathway pseudopilin PulG
VRFRARPHGFSVVELGISLAMVSVLAGVVLVSRGLIATARHQSTVDLLQSTREAARQWAARQCNGLGYQCTIGGSTTLRKLSWTEMSGLPAAGPVSPWSTARMTLVPESASASCGGAIPSCMRIEVAVPDVTRCSDLEKTVAPPGSPEKNWSGIISASCTARAGWLRIVSR